MYKQTIQVIQRPAIAKLGSVVVAVALVAGTALPSYALAAEEATAGSGGAMEQPPDKPDGDEAPGGLGGGPGGGGEAPSGEVPDKPDGEGGPGGGPGGANTQSFDYSGTYTGAVSADATSEDATEQTIEATEALTNAALAQNGGTLNVAKSTLTKQGDATDGDACNFYGVNSIALAVGEGSQLNISDTKLSATSEGSNAVFATDSATAFVYNSTIETSADNSRGLDATYGGTIVASAVTATTQGNHCAGIATDRGGGNVSAANCTFTTNGSGSPVLYSTGCVEVSDIEGTATGSQIAGMEGLNTIRISNSTLTSTITGPTASDPIADGVIIYQSTSGDAETSDGSRALFQAVDSKLTSAIQSGAMFYVTNTSADIVLSNTTLDFDTSAANLLTIAGNDANSWGKAGSNGGDVTLTAQGQQLVGDVDVDAISSLDLYLTEGSSLEGAVNTIDNESGYTSDGSIDVVVDANSTWTVTGDSTVSNLSVANGGKVVDASGNAVTIVAGGQTVVQGSGSVTVTVSGAYASTADTSGAVAVSENTIDRAAFNEYYNIDNSAATPASTATTSETATLDEPASTAADQPEEEGGFFGWLHGVWTSFLGLFGL